MCVSYLTKVTCRSMGPFISMSGAQKLDILCERNETEPLFHIIHKSQHQVSWKSNVKGKTVEPLRWFLEYLRYCRYLKSREKVHHKGKDWYFTTLKLPLLIIRRHQKDSEKPSYNLENV